MEDLQVIAEAAAALWLFLLQRRHHGLGRGMLLMILAVTLFLVAEELSWGQRVLGFTTPESLKAYNRQGEFNLHNSAAFQPWRHGILLLVGAGGLLGILLRRPLARRLPALAGLLPPPHFAACFLWILAAAAALGFAWFKLPPEQAEALQLPPSAAGRIISEGAELIVALTWSGLCYRAWRHG